MAFRILWMGMGLALLATPAWAPTVTPVPAGEADVQWRDALELAGEFRLVLRGDSARLTDSLAYEIVRAADRYHMDRRIAFRLVWAESRFNTAARGKVGDAGLTQVLPGTARLVCKVTETRQLYDPATNLDCGFKYFSQLLDRYDDIEWFALVGYNRGPRIADSLKAQGLGYPERILAMQ